MRQKITVLNTLAFHFVFCFESFNDSLPSSDMYVKGRNREGTGRKREKRRKERQY
jgi:hypothetical protein